MSEHWPTLVFEDGDGDLCRCDCGEQGFDFKQGREWFAQHLAARDRPGLDVERLALAMWNIRAGGSLDNRDAADIAREYAAQQREGAGS